MKTPGRVAFEAWCAATADQVPKHDVTWERLPPSTQNAWEQVAFAVEANQFEGLTSQKSVPSPTLKVPHEWGGLGK
jgi:hypothetical protein